jgi:hypothetical protein
LPSPRAIVPGFLARAIRSVLGQTFEDFELLVLDDASESDLQAGVTDFADAAGRGVFDAEITAGRPDVCLVDTNMAVFALRVSGVSMRAATCNVGVPPYAPAAAPSPSG